MVSPVVASSGRRLVSAHGKPAELKQGPAIFSREERAKFLDVWLQYFFSWKGSGVEPNVLMWMIYTTLAERGVMADHFPNPAEEEFPQDSAEGEALAGGFSHPAEEEFPRDPDYAFSDRPSPFFMEGGICDIILARAEAWRVSPEEVLKRIFGDNVSADGVFWDLFGERPPDTKGVVFRKKKKE